MKDTNKQVAIIMRSKNEMPYVQHALEALKRQTYSNFTLYNVDSGSTDGTLEHVTQATNLLLRIKPEEYVPGPILERMIGYTQEPVIVFLNADAIPLSDNWLEEMVQPLFENKASCLFCKQVPRKDASFAVRYDYERMYTPKTIEKAPLFFTNVAAAFRREALVHVPFPQLGYSEDIAWWVQAKAQGYNRLYLDHIAVEHSHNYTLKQLYKRGYIEGQAAETLAKASAKKNFSFFRNLYQLIREITRDTLYTCSTLRIHCLPAIWMYRLVFRCGFYLGERSE